MAYRPTERTNAQKAATRERIVAAALEQISREGYAGAQIANVAERAGVATGTVYRHFPSKSELFAEVFRRASQREVDAMSEAGREDGRPAAERAASAIEGFARRALAGRRLAYALIAEPVDPAVEAERLVFRRAYHRIVAEILEDGIASGEFPAQDVAVSSAALVGALGEALVGPLSPTSRRADRENLISALLDFCARSVTGKEPAYVNA